MIFLIIFIILFFFAVIRPCSRFVTILISLFMIFMYAFTWHAGDLEVYEWVYRDFLIGQFYTAYEPGFIGIMWLCRSVGLSFTLFRLLLGLFIVVSVYRIIQRQTIYTALVMALFGVFPFFMFVSVLRSGIACVFVLLAIEQLMSTNPNKKKFLIYLIIGTLFHYSTILFLPCILFSRKIKKSTLVVAFIGMCGLAFLVTYTDVFYQVVSKFTQRQKILGWLSKNDATANTTGMIAIVFLLLTVFLLNRYIYRNTCIIQWGNESIISDQNHTQVRVSYQLSIYMLLLLPLMILASPIMRIPYMAFPVFMIAAINTGGGKIYSLNKYNNSYTILITSLWVVLLGITLIWKCYADLPYLKEGSSLFSEFLDSQLLLQ